MSASVSNFSGAVARVQQLRADNCRQSKEVVDLWKAYLSTNQYGLGADKWLTLEQVFIAALDIGDFDLAAEIYKTLHTKFSGGIRLKRLKGMFEEAKDEYEKAETIYQEILEEDPLDSATHKRLAAMCKAQGKISEAVQTLNKYLEINSMDFDGWMELSDLYLSQYDYDKAAFCLEELILINPYNHLFHQKYAEIKYSQGDFELARVYYSQAYRLSNENVRALYGSVLCSQKLAAGKSKSKSENVSMAKKALDELEKKFEKEKASTAHLHKAAMKNLMDSIA